MRVDQRVNFNGLKPLFFKRVILDGTDSIKRMAMDIKSVVKAPYKFIF